MLRDQQSLSIIAPLFPRVQGNQAGVLGGCAGGVAPLRPYDMVGRDFRCFAALRGAREWMRECTRASCYGLDGPPISAGEGQPVCRSRTHSR
jgi:hypothetical protein